MLCRFAHALDTLPSPLTEHVAAYAWLPWVYIPIYSTPGLEHCMSREHGTDTGGCPQAKQERAARQAESWLWLKASVPQDWVFWGRNL